jgi:DNA-binding GntR family transcriptional regulator
MPMSEPNLVKAVSLVDQVTHHLRERIINGELPAGRSISIIRLAEQMDVSHIPVREALRRLETEGLVAIRAGRGAMITPLRTDDVRGIYRIRRWIEPELAALSSEMITKRDFTMLEECLQVLTEGSVEDEITAHKDFHLMLLRPASSAWDIRILEYLWNANERYTRLYFLPPSHDHPKSVAASHVSLYKAMKSRNPDRIREKLREHLDDNQNALLEALEPSGIDGSTS